MDERMSGSVFTSQQQPEENKYINETALIPRIDTLFV